MSTCSQCTWWHTRVGVMVGNHEPMEADGDQRGVCSLTITYGPAIPAHPASLATTGYWHSGGDDGFPTGHALYTRPDFGCVQFADRTTHEAM